MTSTLRLAKGHALSRKQVAPIPVDAPLGNRCDLPVVAGPHRAAFLGWALAGIAPEEQIRLLRAFGSQGRRQ